MRELKVEMRKCFLRLDFYGAVVSFAGVIGFFVYQICTEGSVITLQGASENLTFNELLLGILQMAHSIGLTGILLAILCWRTLGKEFDQKSIVMYILHARSKWKVLLAKFVTLLVAFIMILFIALAVSFLIYTFTAPANLEIITTLTAIKHFASVVLLMILNSSISILLACVLAMRFGTLGVLASTIGLSIFSAIFQSNATLKQILPSQLIHLEETSFSYNITVLVTYALLLILMLKVMTTRNEITN